MGDDDKPIATTSSSVNFLGSIALLTSPVTLFVEVPEIYHSMTGITLARDMVRCATAIVAPDFAVSASCPLP